MTEVRMGVNLVCVFLLLIGLDLMKAEIPKIVIKGLQKCFDKGGINGVVNCAGLRTLNMVTNLAMKDKLEIVPGIILQRGNDHMEFSQRIKEEDLPKNPTNLSEKIIELIGNATVSLLSERTLTIKIPKVDTHELARAFNGDEGRARKKNKMGGFGGMMLPFMLSMAAKVIALIAGVGLLSAKAAIVAKLALLISVLLVVQYYFSRTTNTLPSFYGGGSYPQGTYGTNNLGGWNAQYPYARSLEVGGSSTETYEGEQVAYNGYTQAYN